MSEAVAVRRDGDRFQARMFWKYGAQMLTNDDSSIIRVGFETGPKGFDDIWVEYDPVHAPGDGCGGRIHRRHVQCKWHASPNVYTYDQLIDPDFINATSRSLLQRALDAQRIYAPHGDGSVFELTTNWRIHHEDPLQQLVNTRFGGIRLEHFFQGKTTKSAMKRLRDCWQSHLGLDDAELRALAKTLRFASTPETLVTIGEQLNRDLRYAGLKPVPADRSSFPYDEVVFAWLGEGSVSFDREQLRDACRREGLIGDSEPRPRIFGVKSFEHPIDRLEHRCEAILDLVPEFSKRFIHDDVGWSTSLYPQLKEFLLGVASEAQRVRLALDAHSTLAFAAGSVLDTKCGRVVELEQRTPAYKIWTPDDEPVDDAWPGFEFVERGMNLEGGDIALAVGLTHDIGAQVEAYIKTQLPSVGALVVAIPEGGASPRSVRCGAHADRLATQITNAVRAIPPSERKTLHLFVAAPNAFTFMLGQRQALLGRTRLYEFDFEGLRTSSYEASLELPIF